MDTTVLVSAFFGAILGAGTSILTLFVQNYFQNKREVKKMIFDNAWKDYEIRILHAQENGPRMASFPTILAYHQEMMNLLEHGQLTPDKAKDILRAQAEMNEALWQAAKADNAE